MKRLSWQGTLGLSLVAVSGLVYLIHYAVFRDAHHIFIYMVGDIAFVPIEVLLVTLIMHRVLSDREKRLSVNRQRKGHSPENQTGGHFVSLAKLFSTQWRKTEGVGSIGGISRYRFGGRVQR